MVFDSSKAPYKQPERPAQSSEDKPKLKKISPEELKSILKEHKEWVESEGRKGNEANINTFNLQEADLSKANLQRADLRWADLKKAQLFEANLKNTHLSFTKLQNADLRDANLQGANLIEANLQKASFNNTILREANLQDADLTGATGLLTSQFGGTNVSGAKLPDDIAKFEGLSQIKEISQRAQKLFLSILLGSVYCWLTITTTTDVELITNSGSSPLPIIQTKIPIAGFYWAAPLILLSLYLWFHLYLQRLWENLSELPAVFQNGKTLDKKVYPWLISGIVSSHFWLLKAHRPALSRVQTGLSILLAWWLVPFTFLFFWLRYIPRHDWVGTSIHIAVLGVSITTAFMLYRLAAKTLRGEKTFSVPWKEKWKNFPAYQPISLTLGILGLCLLTFLNLSTLAIEADPRAIQGYSFAKALQKTYDTNLKWYDSSILTLWLFNFLGHQTHANLFEANLSTKPPAWTGQKEKLSDQIPRVKGAKLDFANLQYATMGKAFLINANLSHADMREAHLREAYLQYADLDYANLYRANLERADLLGATLRSAKLMSVILRDANLEKADLTGADLQHAYLSGANLEEAHLQIANLSDAFLGGAKLRGANLGQSNLRNTDLRETDLDKANLHEADLTNVRNFTQAQLNQTCVNEYTRLPKELARPEPCSESVLSSFRKRIR